MATFFSIDPSIRACGYALLINSTVSAGLFRSKEKEPARAILQIYNCLKTICPPVVDHLIIEKPIIEDDWTQQKKEAIAKLMACYGMCLTLATDKTKLWTPSVPEWKGQLSKENSHIRTEDLLRKEKIKIDYVGKIPDSLMHNTKDAIALLTKYLIKERII